MIANPCPYCGHRGSLGDESGDRQVRCKKCKNVITIPGAAPGVTAMAPASPPGDTAEATGGIQPTRIGMSKFLRHCALLLAIVGFIGSGLIVLFGLFVTAFLSGAPYRHTPDIEFVVVILATATAWFVASLYLMRYARKRPGQQ